MVRTRFAPSPTGFMHIGGIRTALYSYALAKRNNGKFILRIEDTDKKREIDEGIGDIIRGLKVFGLNYDEGPNKGGDYGPYIQSKRLDIYKKKAEELVDKGKAYYCFCSKKRLEKVRKKQQKEGKQPMYDRKCRDIDIKEAKERIRNGENYVIRLKIPNGRNLEINDKLMGRITWNSDDVDDQVLLKSDGYPTYHLAVVVDDVLMKISHITRGIEWLASVPKHILLYEAFGYKFPITAHMPVILDPDGGKLSKRKGVVSVRDFLKQGYLPEALLNFLMLLGWSPDDDREFFSLKEFVKEFSLERLNKASPVFNRQKLIWFNGEYIRNYSKKLFTKKVREWVKKYCEDKEMVKNTSNDEKLINKLALIQERVSLLSEVVDSIRFFYKRLEVPKIKSIKGVKRYESTDYKNAINDYTDIITSYDSDTENWEHKVWESDIRKLSDKYKWRHGDMFMLIRLVICGSPVSPPLFESLIILSKDEVLVRLNDFISEN